MRLKAGEQLGGDIVGVVARAKADRRTDQLLLQLGDQDMRLVGELGPFLEPLTRFFEQGLDLDQSGGNRIVGHFSPVLCSRYGV